MLGASTRLVRKLEGKGLLKPIVLDDIHYFTRQAVHICMESRLEAASGKAFALFREGVAPIDVVVELGDVDPDHILALWESYNRFNHCWVIQGPSSLKAWEPVFQLGELTPELLLRCIEIVCGNPTTRALLKSSAHIPRRKDSRGEPA